MSKGNSCGFGGRFFWPVLGKHRGRLFELQNANGKTESAGGGALAVKQAQTAIAGYSPPLPNEAPDSLSSISQHVFAVWHRVHIATRFVDARSPEVPGGGGLAGGSCQAPRWRRMFSTTRGSSITAMIRIGFSQTGQRSGSACQTRRIRSRHRLDGSFSGGREETPGRGDGHAGRGGLPDEINLRRSEAVRLVDEVAEGALQFQDFSGEGAGGFDGAGVLVPQRVKAGGGQGLLPASDALYFADPGLGVQVGQGEKLGGGLSMPCSTRGQSGNVPRVCCWRDGREL